MFRREINQAKVIRENTIKEKELETSPLEA